jgi:molybdenum cofactor cytidylyltransferase
VILKGIKLQNSVALLLAAGRSSRMGKYGPKGLLDFYGEPWISKQLKSLMSCGLGRIAVVLGYEKEAYLRVLASFGDSIDIFFNEEPERGQFSSLQCGLKGLEAYEHSRILITTLDTPMTSRENIETMSGSSASIIIPSFKTKGGHPIFISADFANSLLGVDLANENEARLDVQIKKLASQEVVKIAIEDPKIIMNLNTPEKWDEFKKSCH